MRVICGVERLALYPRLFRGKKAGLITNFSGISPDWSADTVHCLIDNGCDVCTIFTPEHGLYGAEAGKAVENTLYPGSKIPVTSLYGERRRPTAEDLRELELLVYDIQDVGLRYYTYVYTLCYALEAAAELGLPFVVLDRPDPLGGRIISGAKMDSTLHSFVGDYELPMRYALTPGEMARYFLKYTGLSADLTVVKLENYTRDQLFPDQGLLWNIPSPALPSFESVICYSGGCLFEALNISEGRGTAKPFQFYGAPFIDMDQLYSDMKEISAEGKFAFRRRSFTPSSGKYSGELCFGLEFCPLAPDADFLLMALQLMRVICRRWPAQLALSRIPGEEEENQLTILSGNHWAEQYISGSLPESQLQENWKEQCSAFEKYTADVRLYT